MLLAVVLACQTSAVGCSAEFLDDEVCVSASDVSFLSVWLCWLISLLMLIIQFLYVLYVHRLQEF